MNSDPGLLDRIYITKLHLTFVFFFYNNYFQIYRIVLQEIPDSGLNFDNETMSMMDHLLLEKVGYTVLSFPKMKNMSFEHKIDLIRIKLLKIGVKIKDFV